MNNYSLTFTPLLIVLLLLAVVFLGEGYILLGYAAKKCSGKKVVVRRRHWVVHALTAVLVGCLLYAAFVEPYWPQVTTVRLGTDKLQNTTLRIVQISDLHCDPKARLEPRLATIVNGLDPDIIVFTGDAINSRGGLELFQQTLAAMEAPLGKFAVRGNWDYRFGTGLFEHTGFEELSLRAVRLEKDGELFMVCGIGYHQGRISQRAIGQLDLDTWNVLLYHSPDLIAYLHGQPIDLYLAGHTHGGQVALPFYGAITTLSRHGKSFEAGLYQVGDIAMYVNRGIGMSGVGPRVRFFARPEITLFEIYPADAHGSAQHDFPEN